MDVLSDVLALARVESALMATVDARGRWGLDLPARQGASFHTVVAGTCWLVPHLPGADRGDAAGGPAAARQLTPGDVVLLPSGIRHELSSEPPGPTAPPSRPFDENLKRELITAGGELVLGGTGPRTRILCAGYGYATGPDGGAHPVLGLLPPVLHVATAQPDAGHWLRTVLDLLAHEARSGAAAGADTAVVRLLDVLLVHVVRAWIDGAGEAVGDRADAPGRTVDAVGASWLTGLRDPLVARALAALHEQPSRAWTLDALAAALHTSRATLARRFTAHVGEPPLSYLTRWRMHLAAERLRTTTLPAATIAREVGYTSEYAFNRAFARLRGSPPGRYRTSRREPAVPR